MKNLILFIDGQVFDYADWKAFPDDIREGTWAYQQHAVDGLSPWWVYAHKDKIMGFRNMAEQDVPPELRLQVLLLG
jgi:hypothetical protein